MQIFYAPDIEGSSYTLDEKESNHCIRVLRMREGDQVKLIDGRGGLYEGLISDADQKKCKISITNVLRDYEKRSYRLHVAISPIKNPERYEWFIEKSVEIGIDKITPLICHNTEKQGVKTERINNLIISAMKQSLKSEKSELMESKSFNEFIAQSFSRIKMIAHCDKAFPVKSINDVYKPNDNAVILIGPEGDFTSEEIRSAIAAGFIPVHLGKSRLRTETAGIAACHSIYFMNQ
jgi:16S rRNA (uracil1498-N3)-methyltransferase